MLKIELWIGDLLAAMIYGAENIDSLYLEIMRENWQACSPPCAPC
jgi:hypothetical protein